MLCVNNYPQEYIDQCRARITAQVSAYQRLIAAARDQTAGDNPLLDPAIEAFDPHFFNNMLLVLESQFMHRARGKEGKDGNPLNEVRMLCNSILNNNSVMSADKTIKYAPANTVLKRALGDEIRLSEADFLDLSSAFFAEIERKYL